MSAAVHNVLFLCTGNSARSILAEAILRKDGAGRFNAYSAGSHPKGQVHPKAIEILGGLGFPTEGLRSKSWEEFTGADAPAMDFIVTVCDNAAGESCPVWPGVPMTAHWGIADPAEAGEAEQHQAFLTALRQLRTRIDLFLQLPFNALDEMSLRQRLRDIGSAARTPAAV